jgi:DNA invertase Pin-like site-specific DNA recombinase
MKTISITPGTRAYSYRRFSSAAQSDGDSLRRQTAAAERFAETHGLILDTELTFQDLGVSAYKGKNRTEGALAAFMNAVEEGQVPKGSYLLVENLDRLSREQVSRAYRSFTEILDLDIRIATLTDGRIYSTENMDVINLMISLMSLHRANEESEVKSQRLRAAWAEKRATASDIKMTSSCPHWLQLNDDRSEFNVIPDKAETVRHIFELYLNGMGKAAIASQLNEQAIAPIGTSNGWHHSYITKLLKNIAIIGNFQPHRTETIDGKRKDMPEGQPIEGYYPAIVDKATFYRAQKQRESRALPRGRRGSGFPNLLRGIANCEVCGGTMHYISKGTRRGNSRRPDAYLQCSNAKRKASGCDHTSLWNYYAVERFVIEGINDIDFTSLFPDITAENSEELTKAEADHDVANGELVTVEEHLRNIADALMTQPQSSTLMKRLSDLETRQLSLTERVGQTATQVEMLKDRLQTTQQRFDTQDELLGEWEKNKSDPMLRSKLNRSLAGSIASMEFSTDPVHKNTKHIRSVFNSAASGQIWNIVIETLAKGQYHGLTLNWGYGGNPGNRGRDLFHPAEIEEEYWAREDSVEV